MTSKPVNVLADEHSVLCTVNVLVGRHSVLCNKERLMEVSDYFQAMFGGSFAESDKKEIRLELDHPTLFKAMIQSYDYDNHYLPLTLANVNMYLKAAVMLQLSQIIDYCENFAIEGFTLVNCWKIQKDSYACGALTLYNAARSYSLWNFPSYVQRNELDNLAFDDFEKYIGDYALNTGNLGEKQVAEVVFNYLNANSLSPDQNATLIKHIHFSRLSPSEMAYILNQPIVQSDLELRRLLVPISTIISGARSSLSVENEPLYQDALQLLSKPNRKILYVPCVVGSKLNPINKSWELVVFKYDCHNKSGKQSEELVKEAASFQSFLKPSCIGFSTIGVGPIIYVFGGKLGLKTNEWADISRFNTLIRRMTTRHFIQNYRRHHRMCELNGVFYMVGGLGRFRAKLDVIETMNVETGDLTEIPLPPISMHGGVPCAHIGRLFVFLDNFVCRYEPVAQTWSYEGLQLQPAMSFRHAFSLSTFIFLIEKFGQTVYIYSPAVNKLRKYGTFQSETINVCLYESELFCFRYDGTTGDLIIETLDLRLMNYDIDLNHRWPSPSNVESSKEIDGCVQSEIVWRNKAKNRRFGISREHAYGCFLLHSPY